MKFFTIPHFHQFGFVDFGPGLNQLRLAYGKIAVQKLTALNQKISLKFTIAGFNPDVALELRDETSNGKKSATYIRNA